MIRPDTRLRVYLCREPVVMRKQIDGLALLVQEAMELNPFEEAVFVFGNRQRDKAHLQTAHARVVLQKRDRNDNCLFLYPKVSMHF